MADLTFDQLKQNYALSNGDLQDEPEKTIQEGIDIDKDLTLSEAFEKLLNEHETGAKNLWNESIKTAVAYLCSNVLSNTTKIPNTEIKIEDIKNANAGNSFEENGEWVKPYTNVDGDNYSDVRGSDKIKSVLTNNKNLQYTNETINKYLRLLMPQYTRRVEVEDLNRNFWVIGQTIAGISAYLFDDNSPVNTMLKSLISEVNQLWENLLYLWSDQIITEVHSEVIYLPSSDSVTEMKFDNFDEQFNLNNADIQRRLQYLIDKYPKNHLCIAPIIREDNYYKNYYNNEKYLGIWFYNRNSDTWRRVNTGIKNISGIANSLYFTNIHDEALKTDLLSINPNDQKIYGLKINESTFKYDYVYPLNDIESGLFIGGIRTIPTLKCEYDFEKQTFVGSLEIIAVDYVGEILSNFDPDQYNCRKEILSYSFSVKENSIIRRVGFEYDDFEYESKSGSIDIKEGFYLGEIPSTLKKSGQPQVNLELNLRGISLPPLTESILYIYHPSGTSYTENRRKLLGESKSILNSQVTKDMTTPNKITLFTGMYRADIFSSTQASDIQEYYKQGATGEKDVISIGEKQNYNPVYQLSGTSGEKTNLGNSITYETKVGEKTNTVVKNRDGSKEYWNRFRDYFKIGCKIYIPDGTSDGINLIDDKYEYWHMFINTLEPDPTSTEIKGKHSLIPLYRTSDVEDTANAGRRGAYWYFYTIYKKDNEEITTEGNWAIKLTEVHMDYAPTLDGGYRPGSWAGGNGAYSWSHRPIIVNKTGTSNYIQYEVAGCYYGGKKAPTDPQTGINSISNFYFKAQPRPTDPVEIRKTDPTYTIFRNFAPAYIRGTAGQASTGKYLKELPKYYFLPIVTMVNTHIWIKEPAEDYLKTGNFIQNRIFTDGHYNPAFTTVIRDEYNTLNSYLNNSYTVVRRGSNLASLENGDLECIKEIIKYTGRLSNEFNNVPNNKNPWYWLDFERWPLRGFGPITKTVNGETFEDWADLTIYQP